MKQRFTLTVDWDNPFASEVICHDKAHVLGTFDIPAFHALTGALVDAIATKDALAYALTNQPERLRKRRVRR